MCADSVQLHVIQELLDMFDDNEQSSQLRDETQHQDQLFLTLSVAALSDVPAPHTLCLSGHIQGHPVAILVDSGSSHSFVSFSLVPVLDNVVNLPAVLSVRVANGDQLSCGSFIPQAAWSVDGYSFTSNLIVLPLSTYDIIFGMDWLEQFSPMQVDWK